MNWGGFPVAFRFPVEDLTMETKRRCWSHVLPSLVYADLTKTSLWEAESTELFDPDKKVYLVAIAPTSITPSRKNSLLWRRDGRLMSEVTLYQPVAQENFLELYTKQQKLADIALDRSIVPIEGWKDFFPARIEQAEKAPSHTRALILPKGELPYAARETLCRQTMRELYAADEGLYLRMLPLSPGGEGAVYAAAAFRHGRLFSEMIPDAAGEKRRCLFGVLPGRKLLIDGFTVPDVEAPLRDDYGLGKAIRIARDRGFTDISLCANGLKTPSCEAKLVSDMDELYALSQEFPMYDRVILTEYGADGRIQTETINIDRRDEACVSSILSKRSGTAAN